MIHRVSTGSSSDIPIFSQIMITGPSYNPYKATGSTNTTTSMLPLSM